MRIRSKEKEQVIGGMIAAVISIGLGVYWFTTGHMNEIKMMGVLIGLCTGVCSAVAGQMWEHRKASRMLRVLFFIALSPIGMFFILPFSPGLAGGYFLGSSASFSASWAIAHLITRNEEMEGRAKH
jgi:hypothetical protein